MIRGHPRYILAAMALAALLATGAFQSIEPEFDREAPDGFSRDIHRDWRFVESRWSSPARAEVKGDEMTVFLVDRAPGLAYQGVVDKDWKDATGGDFEVEVDARRATRSERFETKFKVTHDHHKEFIGISSAGVHGLELVQVSHGVRTQTDIAIDRELDRYWRIRHDRAADQIVWLTSRDGEHWTERHHEPRRMDLTETRIEAYAGTFLPVDHPGQVTLRGCC